MRSPNNEKNYRLMCAVLVERGTLRRECGKLLEGKTLDEDERKALYRALVEVADEIAQLANPRPAYTPYSIPEPEEFPPAYTPKATTQAAQVVTRRPVVPEGGEENPEGGEENPEGGEENPEPLRNRMVHPASSRLSGPIRDDILRCVAKAGSLRQVDIANQLGVDIKPLYNIVSSMVRDGHIVKDNKPFGPTSRIMPFVEVTEKGKRELEKIARVQTQTSDN